MTAHEIGFPLADDLLRRFAAALRGMQLYAPEHPIVLRNLDALAEALRVIHQHDASIVIGLFGGELIVGDQPMSKASAAMGELVRRLGAIRVERITFNRGVTHDELRSFLARFGQVEKSLGSNEAEQAAAQLESPNIRVGRVTMNERSPEDGTDIGAVRRLYWEAVSVASMIWESARCDETPDPASAHAMVESLSQAVVTNRAAVLALTALKEYDNYTFTHMVNVSILTMAQARGLGVEGALLRELGLAALMHDIGKVKTPAEILNKPDKLTEEEYEIMKRHTVDGAEMLRTTADIPPLASIVAFEHHLRLDGTGYPAGVARPQLNLATMLCGIADVYDAMRSKRKYQQAHASDRILAVLQRNDGSQFDQHLVRRFVQLVGIYPVGNLVRLNSDEVGVVLRAHAADPFRPKVRILFTADGGRLEMPRDVNLWEADPDSRLAATVVAPLDPKEFGIDPLNFVN